MPQLAAMMPFLRRRHALAGSLLSLGIKAAGALLMVLTFILTARTVSPAAFGHLAIAFNGLSFLAVFAIFGQDTLFVRSWGEYLGRDDGLAHGAFWFGWRVVGAGGALACGAVTLLGIVGPWEVSPGEVAAGCAFLAAAMALQYASNTCRHILNFVISEINRELTWRLVLLAAAAAALRFGFVPQTFFLAAAAGMGLALGIEAAALRRGFPQRVAAAPVRTLRAAWLRRARSMWMSASIEATAQYAEVMLLGLVVSPAAAGGYFVAARIANVFAMLATGLHTYTVSYAATLYFNREIGRLQGILRAVMSVALALTAPLLAVVVFAGSRILGLFGAPYADQTGVLLLLSGASFVATTAGPTSGILQITGHEGLYARVVACALLVRLGLLLWLAPRYGAFGAALGWAAVTAPVSVGLAIACRSLCGIDPSVLSVVRRRGAFADDPTA